MRHKHVGELVRVARERRGLSQRALAKLISTQQSAVSELETGEAAPVMTTFLRAMDAMDFDVQVTVMPRENWQASGVMGVPR